MTTADAMVASDTVRDLTGARDAADDLAHLVYRATWKFVQNDAHLAQRMRGVAISMAARIGEAGQAPSPGRSREALQAASARLSELNYYVQFVRRAGLMGETDVKRIRTLSAGVERILMGMLASMAQNEGDPKGE